MMKVSKSVEHNPVLFFILLVAAGHREKFPLVSIVAIGALQVNGSFSFFFQEHLVTSIKITYFIYVLCTLPPN